MPKKSAADAIFKFPPKGVTKSNEHGMEQWNFTVKSENYGELLCSFYPHLAEHSFCQYFTRLMTGASGTDVIEPMLAFNEKNPGVLQAQVLHAMLVLERNLPNILERSLALAGQIAIDRAIFQGAGLTHRLGKTKASDGSEQLVNTALRIVRDHVRNPTRTKRKITTRDIRAAINAARKKWGPKLKVEQLAEQLDISDTQLRKYYLEGERFPAFLQRHELKPKN